MVVTPNSLQPDYYILFCSDYGGLPIFCLAVQAFKPLILVIFYIHRFLNYSRHWVSVLR